jgi:Rrf2 family protein
MASRPFFIVVSHFGNKIEYGLHCLVWLAKPHAGWVSSGDLAELQEASASLLAKILPRLQKAGIVSASEGVRGGYRLARNAQDISVLEIVDAIEGNKPSFECMELRRRCALFGKNPPAWSTGGLCAIHSVMIRAEKALRDDLAQTTLSEIARSVSKKVPVDFSKQVTRWLEVRATARIDGHRL